MLSLNIKEIINELIQANTENRINEFNTYLQQVINALVVAVSPELEDVKKKYFEEGELPSQFEPKDTCKLLDNIVELNCVANWINNDVNNHDKSELDKDAKLLYKLDNAVKAGKWLDAAKLPRKEN